MTTIDMGGSEILCLTSHATLSKQASTGTPVFFLKLFWTPNEWVSFHNGDFLQHPLEADQYFFSLR